MAAQMADKTVYQTVGLWAACLDALMAGQWVQYLAVLVAALKAC